MHYEDKKTGFKFDAVIGLPKENTAEAFEELFAANKATEEGELPLWHHNEHSKEMHPDPCGEWVRADTARFAIERAIAADRASRQVANKAEDTVEVPAQWLRNLAELRPEVYSYDGLVAVTRAFCNCADDFSAGITPLFATPPATTGASTAPRPTDDELWDATLRDRDAYHDWADKLAGAIAKHFGVDIGEHSNQNLPWDEALQAIENAEPVGASTAFMPTVLADERIIEEARDWGLLDIQDGGRVDRSALIGFVREVAAQAGQVAVPGWISVDERLPDAGHCLATYRNQHGKLRIIRAKYARQFEIDAGEDAIDQGNCEYNEADDTFYLKAGWLECIDNWDDYSSIYVTEGEVTHWSPLPAAPSPAKESK